MSNKTQVFTPEGGMNQDDSILTPTPNTAGRNAFGLGDYRYALNARIGSSRSDNFGDVENLRGTIEKTDYAIYTKLFTNGEFTGSLTPWIQTGGGSSWFYSTNAAQLNAGAITSKILYQGIVATLKPIRLTFRWQFLTSTAVISATMSIKYMSGSTVLSTETLDTIHSLFGDRTVTLNPPVGCDGIGVMVSKPGSSPVFSLTFFNTYSYVSGTKPAGTEKVIGKFESREFNLLYYHVWNSNGNHCIRYYDPYDETIYELLKWSGLNYSEDGFVSSEMIDNFMGFTDRENAPRLIDVNTIGYLFTTLTSTQFREYHISFHKWAPIMPPILKLYYNGSTNNYKKFENKIFQFAYRYVYNSRLKSRWSTVSNSAQHFESNSGNEITSIQLNIPGFSLDVPGAATQYNYFNNSNVKFVEAVEFIEVAYRENSLDPWRMFSRSTVINNPQTVFRFDGNVNGTPIAQDDFNQLFDVVPFRCGAISAIDNRFVFADCEDEKEAADTPEVTGVGVAKYTGSSTLLQIWDAGTNNAVDNASFFPSLSPTDADELGKRNAISHQTFKGRGLYKLGIVWLAENGWRSGVYTSDDWTFDIPAETGITDKIYALTFSFLSTYKPPLWAVAYQIVRTDCLNIDYFMFGAANKFEPLIDDPARVTGNTSLSNELKDRIRQHFENSRLVTGTEYADYLTTLKNNPFHNSVVSEVRKTLLTTVLPSASRISIDMYNWYNSSKKTSAGTVNNPLNKLFYNYREGDRVRFLASTQSAPTNDQKVVYDVPILEFTGVNIIIEKPLNILWLPSTGDELMIEVYTPRVPQKSSDYLYYENGEWYPVLYPGTSQRDFSKKDWSYPSDNSAITCTTYGDVKVFNKRPFAYGDCHAILKTFYYDYNAVSGTNSITAYAPSMNPDPNKTFGYWEQNDGRAYPAYTDLPVVKFKGTQVRFGGQAVEQSFVNNINRVREEDQKIFPSEYGRIRFMMNTSNAQVESVGAILFCVGEHEAFSVYVNRTTLEDLSGQTQVALSDKVLGSYNTLLGSFGTLNPESASINDGRIYYWCASMGSWIRYGRDGLTPISQYKMRNWFKEIGNLLRQKYGTDENPRAISEYDSFNEELVTYINHSELPSTLRGYSTYKGSMFSEDDKRWKSVHSYDPEFFAKLNDKLYSFRGGSIFIHEQDTDAYSTFYGTKYDVKIQPVFNEIPKDVKSWQNIALVATDRWSFELESEYRGARTKQQSTISIDELDMREDVYYSDLKLDANSLGGRVDGDKMRSKAIKVMATLDPDIDRLSLLQYIEVGDIDSPKNA